MDLRKVKKLIELLEESNVAEIEIHEGEESVRISRASQVVAPVANVVQVAEPPRAAAPPSSASLEVGPGSGSGTEALEGFVVKAPMVGTYYNAPSPASPQFVSVGKSVARGDVLCIIEAMKIMNQIESERAGKIGQVLVENGQPVEFGQPLFTIV